MNKEQYIKQNLYIKHTQAQTKMKQDLKNITQSKYLPSININYSYIDNHTIDKQTKTYGFNVVIPFSFNTFDEIESKKIDYLKSKNLFLDQYLLLIPRQFLIYLFVD